MATTSTLDPESTSQIPHPMAGDPDRRFLADLHSLGRGIVPQDGIGCGIQGTVVDARAHLPDQYVIVDRIRGPHECL